MITRSNYETWFVNYLDGNLNPSDLKLLRRFLNENPDLAEELQDVSEVEKLPEFDEHFSSEKLKKNIAPVGKLNEQNYEEALIAMHEGDLSTSEKEQLEQFLEKNTFLKVESDAFARIRVSHAEEKFPNRSKLKHTPVISFVRWSAAIAATLLITVGAFQLWNKEAGSGVQTLQSVSVWINSPIIPSFETPQADVIQGMKNTNVSVASVPKISESPGKQTTIELNVENWPVWVSNGISPDAILVLDNFSFENTEFTTPKEFSSVGEIAGVVLETGIGESGLSEGLKNKRKITAGDMADVAALPFKNAENPFISSRKKEVSDKRDVKIKLGIFEAEFALK